MKRRLAILLSFLLSFAGAISVDALDTRVDLNDLDQEEASAVDDLDDFLTANRSGAMRNRWTGRKLPARALRAYYARQAKSSSRSETKPLPCFSNRKLYSLQEVFRI